MTSDLDPQWSRHLQAIADELRFLSAVCDVRLRDSGVIERIIRNDEAVCGRKTEQGFRKLRCLVIASYDSLGKSIDRIGAEETIRITVAIDARGPSAVLVDLFSITGRQARSRIPLS